MTREEVLNKAKECVCQDREAQYGSPEDNFKDIARFWNTYLGDIVVDAKDVAMMLALLKVVRIRNGHFKEDSYIDAAGYMACACEVESKIMERKVCL